MDFFQQTPLQCFDVSQQWMVKIAKKWSPLMRAKSVQLMGFSGTAKNTYFQVLLMFLSLRYDADLGRSRLFCVLIWSLHFSSMPIYLPIL